MNTGSDFTFERKDVHVETTTTVRRFLENGDSCLVVGQWGSGKSHAVRKAVNGVVWIDLDQGPLQHPRFVVDAARQIEGGRTILEHATRRGIRAALDALEEQLGDRHLIIDRGERLRDHPAVNWDDPSSVLWQTARRELREWIFGRARKRPTVVVSRRPLHAEGWPDDESVVKHRPPTDWPLKLTNAEHGFRDWRRLARVVGCQPGGLVLGRALLPLMPATEFNRLLDDIEWEAEEQAGGESLRGGLPYLGLSMLGRRLTDLMPGPWRRVLALVDALDGVDDGDLQALLQDTGDRHAYRTLLRLELIEHPHGRVSVLPTARRAGIMGSIDAGEAAPLLKRAAAWLCDAVNDRMTLEPADAERIFRAHRVYVQLGEIDQARRTARLHVAGLVDVARRVSLAGHFVDARDLYSAVLGLLDDAPQPATTSLRQLRSYVIHYRAYNGRRAGITPGADALDAYSGAVELWPENALWRGRLIGLLVELGRLEEAQTTLKRAYGEGGVPDHPRRDFYLRVRPAWSALEHGIGDWGLEWIDSLIGRLDDRDPDGAASIEELLARWRSGAKMETLQHDGGLLVFTAPAEVRLREGGKGWQAVITRTSTVGSAPRPAEAVRRAARRLADDAHRLLSAPSWRLDEAELRGKSTIISFIDLLNSDIGFQFEPHRWVLGRIDDGRFVPVQKTDLAPVRLDSTVEVSGERPGLFMGRFPAHRDGTPSGPIDRLKPVGSGRRLDELLEALRRIEAHDSAA